MCGDNQKIRCIFCIQNGLDCLCDIQVQYIPLVQPPVDDGADELYDM
jgi:hypothetical protein